MEKFNAQLFSLQSRPLVPPPSVVCQGVVYWYTNQNKAAKRDYGKKYVGYTFDENTQKFTDGKKFGFVQDNFIGAKSQKNVNSDSWITFFRDSRLEPQFKEADSYFDTNERKLVTKLLDHLDEFLVEPENPSLLHGDLWKGNSMCGSDGKAWLIDPAGYVGHAETDLAMTELFGGFPQEFYDAYKEANPLKPGYDERRDLYNLYHLLNHLNMFGEGYLNPVKSIIEEYTK